MDHLARTTGDGVVSAQVLAGATPLVAEDGGAERRIKLAVRGMTCGNCVRHVWEALAGTPGVDSATVDLARGAAEILYDPARVDVPGLQKAVEDAGYVLDDQPLLPLSRIAEANPQRRLPVSPILAGVVASALLASIYVAVVGIAQGLDHAFQQATDIWYLVLPILGGFGVQVGLFVHLRRSLGSGRGTGSTKALTGVGTGTSTVSMAACCAHHLTDVLPFIGISGAALFLNEYRVPLMVLGVAGNAVGIGMTIRMLRRHRHCIAAT